MPYKLERSGSGYYVVGPSGRKSNKPLSHERAQAQMRALYANEPGLQEGGTMILNPNKPSHRAIIEKQATVPEGKDLPMTASSLPRGARVNMGGKQKKQKTANRTVAAKSAPGAAPNPNDPNTMQGMPPVMALPQPGSVAPGFLTGGKVKMSGGRGAYGEDSKGDKGGMKASLKGGKGPIDKSGKGMKRGTTDSEDSMTKTVGAGKEGGKEREEPRPGSLTGGEMGGGTFAGETPSQTAFKYALGIHDPIPDSNRSGEGGEGPVQKTGKGGIPKKGSAGKRKAPYGFKKGGKIKLSKEEEEEEDEESGYKDGGNWIAGATKNKGGLHRSLGVPAGEKIPAGKIEAAAKRGGKVGRQARLAQTLKGLK